MQRVTLNIRVRMHNESTRPPFYVTLHVPNSDPKCLVINNQDRDTQTVELELSKTASHLGIFVWGRDSVGSSTPKAYALQGHGFQRLYELSRKGEASVDLMIGVAEATSLTPTTTGIATVSVQGRFSYEPPRPQPITGPHMMSVNHYCTDVSDAITTRYKRGELQVNSGILGPWLFNDFFTAFPPFMTRVPMWAFTYRANEAVPSEEEERTLENILQWCVLRVGKVNINFEQELLNEACTFLPLLMQYRTDHTGRTEIDQWESVLNNPVTLKAGLDCEDATELVIHVFNRIKRSKSEFPLLKTLRSYITPSTACMASVSLVTLDQEGKEQRGFHAAAMVVHNDWLEHAAQCALDGNPLSVKMEEVFVLEGTGYVGAFPSNLPAVEETSIDWWMRQPLPDIDSLQIKQPVAVARKHMGTRHEHLFVLHTPGLVDSHGIGEIMFEQDGKLGVELSTLNRSIRTGSIKCFTPLSGTGKLEAVTPFIKEVIESQRILLPLPPIVAPTKEAEALIQKEKYVYWCPEFSELAKDRDAATRAGAIRLEAPISGRQKIVLYGVTPPWTS